MITYIIVSVVYMLDNKHYFMQNNMSNKCTSKHSCDTFIFDEIHIVCIMQNDMNYIILLPIFVSKYTYIPIDQL